MSVSPPSSGRGPLRPMVRGASARGRASWQRAVARTVEAKQANCERRVGAEDRQEERDGEDAGRGPRERVARLDDRRLRRLWSWLATTSKMRVHYELRLWSRRHVEIFRACRPAEYM